MAREKQKTPLRRDPTINGLTNAHSRLSIGKEAKKDLGVALASVSPDSPGFTQLVICVGGIYASLYASSNAPVF